MERNLGDWERVLRVFVGVALFATVFVGPRTLWGLVGLVPLLTGLAGFCPLFSLCGASMCGPTGCRPSGRKSTTTEGGGGTTPRA